MRRFLWILLFLIVFSGCAQKSDDLSAESQLSDVEDVAVTSQDDNNDISSNEAISVDQGDISSANNDTLETVDAEDADDSPQTKQENIEEINEELNKIIEYAELLGYREKWADYFHEDRSLVSYSPDCNAVSDLNDSFGLFSDAATISDQQCVAKIITDYDDALIVDLIKKMEQEDLISFHTDIITDYYADGYYETQYDDNIIRFINASCKRYDGTYSYRYDIMVSVPGMEICESYYNGMDFEIKMLSGYRDYQERVAVNNGFDFIDETAFTEYTSLIGHKEDELLQGGALIAAGNCYESDTGALIVEYDGVPVELSINDEKIVYGIKLPSNSILVPSACWDFKTIRNTIEGEFLYKERDFYFESLGATLEYEFILNDFYVCISANADSQIPGNSLCFISNDY